MSPVTHIFIRQAVKAIRIRPVWFSNLD